MCLVCSHKHLQLQPQSLKSYRSLSCCRGTYSRNVDDSIFALLLLFYLWLIIRVISLYRIRNILQQDLFYLISRDRSPEYHIMVINPWSAFHSPASILLLSLTCFNHLPPITFQDQLPKPSNPQNKPPLSTGQTGLECKPQKHVGLVFPPIGATLPYSRSRINWVKIVSRHIHLTARPCVSRVSPCPSLPIPVFALSRVALSTKAVMSSPKKHI